MALFLTVIALYLIIQTGACKCLKEDFYSGIFDTQRVVLDVAENLSYLSEKPVVFALGFSPAKSQYDSESKHDRSSWVGRLLTAPAKAAL